MDLLDLSNMEQSKTKEEVSKNTENTILENTNKKDVLMKQEIEVQEQKQETKVKEVDKYINALRVWGSTFDVIRTDSPNKYVLCEVLQDGTTRVLTNYLPVITKKMTYTNGIDEKIMYELIIYVLDDEDKKLGPVEITEVELQKLSDTITKYFIGKIHNFSSNSNKKMKEITEIVGIQSIREETIYSHTGFIRTDGGLKYLYQGGCIGTDNTEIKTDLAPYNMEQYCFTENDFDKTEALNTAYSLLDIGDFKIMAPVIAITYLSPLFSLLQENRVLIDFVLLLIGKTGTYKSSLSSLMLSHFGNFTINTLPLSFRATFAGIEKIAFVAKDVLLVIDDYKPEKLETDQEKIMEGVLGLWGDRSKRIKMNSHGGLHKQYAPRGLAIVTGERAPRFSQGRLARALTIYTEEGSINFDKLKEVHSKKEQLAFAMKEYIKWIIANEEDIKAKALYLQEVYSKQIINFQHPRIKQNLVCILIGFTIWLDFMCDNTIIESTRKDELLERTSKVLEEVGRNQESDIEEEDPVKIFFKTIGQLQIAERVYISDYKTGTVDESANGTLIGYFNNETNQYYLIADTVYKEVEKACIGRFIATPKQLYKSLADDGYIVTDKDNRKVVRRTDPRTKNKVEVLIIPQQKWNKAMGKD